MVNIGYGLLIAIVIVAILLCVLGTMKDRKQLGIISYLIAVLLVGLLTFQMSRLIGVCSLLNKTSELSNLVDTFSPVYGRYVLSATSHDIGWFIFRRIMWSVLFLGIGGFCIYTTMDPNSKRKYSRTTGERTVSRKERISSRRRR